MEMRESQYRRALYQVALAINSSLDPREVLTSIARSAATALGTKACSIMLLSPDRRQLLHSASFGLSDWYVRKGPVRVDDSMEETLAGRSVAILDTGSDPRIQYRPQVVQEGVASILSAPIRLRGEVVGLMRIYSSVRRVFTDEEREFAEAVASLGAVALENARRYEEVKRDYDAVRQDLLEWYSTWGLERSADILAGSIAE